MRTVLFGSLCAAAVLTLAGPAPAGAQDRARAADGAEQAAQVGQWLSRAEGVSRFVQQQLARARRDADLRKIECLDRALSEVNALWRTMQMRSARHAQYARLSDGARRDHEFSSMRVMGLRLGELESAAHGCVGSTPRGDGRTHITVTIDPETPDEDPTWLVDPDGDFFVPVVPGPASPTI